MSVLRRVQLPGRAAVIVVPWIWLLLFFLIPFLIVLKISFAETRMGVPPYTPLLEFAADGRAHFAKLNVQNYLFILKESLYLEAFLSSLKVAAVSTIFCLLLGYPMAYGIARADASWRNTLLLPSSPRRGRDHRLPGSHCTTATGWRIPAGRCWPPWRHWC